MKEMNQEEYRHESINEELKYSLKKIYIKMLDLKIVANEVNYN